MDKMQVISVRLTAEEVDQLEQLARRVRYFKRSDMIRAAVQLLTQKLTPLEQHNVLAGYGQCWQGYDFQLVKKDLLHGTKGNPE